MSLVVFVDSDVVISSLLSSSGAAFFILQTVDMMDFYVSNYSIKELKIVAQRLEIPSDTLTILLEEKMKTIDLESSIEEIKKNFCNYIFDINDAHIVAGARAIQARFLITYNIRHFKVEKIKQECDTIVTTPANLLQYLRSI